MTSSSTTTGRTPSQPERTNPEQPCPGPPLLRLSPSTPTTLVYPDPCHEPALGSHGCRRRPIPRCLGHHPLRARRPHLRRMGHLLRAATRPRGTARRAVSTSPRSRTPANSPSTTRQAMTTRTSPTCCWPPTQKNCRATTSSFGSSGTSPSRAARRSSRKPHPSSCIALHRAVTTERLEEACWFGSDGTSRRKRLRDVMTECAPATPPGQPKRHVRGRAACAPTSNSSNGMPSEPQPSAHPKPSSTTEPHSTSSPTDHSRTRTSPETLTVGLTSNTT